MTNGVGSENLPPFYLTFYWESTRLAKEEPSDTTGASAGLLFWNVMSRQDCYYCSDTELDGFRNYCWTGPSVFDLKMSSSWLLLLLLWLWGIFFLWTSLWALKIWPNIWVCFSMNFLLRLSFALLVEWCRLFSFCWSCSSMNHVVYIYCPSYLRLSKLWIRWPMRLEL